MVAHQRILIQAIVDVFIRFEATLYEEGSPAVPFAAAGMDELVAHLNRLNSSDRAAFCAEVRALAAETKEQAYREALEGIPGMLGFEE